MNNRRKLLAWLIKQYGNMPVPTNESLEQAKKHMVPLGVNVNKTETGSSSKHEI